MNRIPFSITLLLSTLFMMPNLFAADDRDKKSVVQPSAAARKYVDTLFQKESIESRIAKCPSLQEKIERAEGALKAVESGQQSPMEAAVGLVEAGDLDDEMKKFSYKVEDALRTNEALKMKAQREMMKAEAATYIRLKNVLNDNEQFLSVWLNRSTKVAVALLQQLEKAGISTEPKQSEIMKELSNRLVPAWVERYKGDPFLPKLKKKIKIIP